MTPFFTNYLMYMLKSEIKNIQSEKNEIYVSPSLLFKKRLDKEKPKNQNKSAFISNADLNYLKTHPSCIDDYEEGRMKTDDSMVYIGSRKKNSNIQSVDIYFQDRDAYKGKILNPEGRGDTWTYEKNQAFMLGAIEAKKHFQLVTAAKHYSRKPVITFTMAELFWLDDNGYTFSPIMNGKLKCTPSPLKLNITIKNYKEGAHFFTFPELNIKKNRILLENGVKNDQPITTTLNVQSPPNTIEVILNKLDQLSITESNQNNYVSLATGAAKEHSSKKIIVDASSQITSTNITSTNNEMLNPNARTFIPSQGAFGSNNTLYSSTRNKLILNPYANDFIPDDRRIKSGIESKEKM